IVEYFRVVRGPEDGGKIRAMNFMAARESLRAELLKLAEKTVKEFDLTDFECFRRVGEVPAGEACLLVRIAAPQYDEAFRSMQDFLKALTRVDVPWQLVH